MFKIGDEWFDGVGNYIIVDVDEDEGRVRTFDFEGVCAWESENSWEDVLVEMGMTPVTEPLSQRIRSWNEMHPDTFSKEYKGKADS